MTDFGETTTRAFLTFECQNFSFFYIDYFLSMPKCIINTLLVIQSVVILIVIVLITVIRVLITILM